MVWLCILVESWNLKDMWMQTGLIVFQIVDLLVVTVYILAQILFSGVPKNNKWLPFLPLNLNIELLPKPLSGPRFQQLRDQLTIFPILGNVDSLSLDSSQFDSFSQPKSCLRDDITSQSKLVLRDDEKVSWVKMLSCPVLVVSDWECQKSWDELIVGY